MKTLLKIYKIATVTYYLTLFSLMFVLEVVIYGFIQHDTILTMWADYLTASVIIYFSTFGYSCFRLYDLKAGDFIVNCPMDFNVNSTDIRAQKNLSILLIGETSIFLRDKVINK